MAFVIIPANSVSLPHDDETQTVPNSMTQAVNAKLQDFYEDASKFILRGIFLSLLLPCCILLCLQVHK